MDYLWQAMMNLKKSIIMKALFLTVALAITLNMAAQEEPREIEELVCTFYSYTSMSYLFEQYLIGEGLFGNAFFIPTVFMPIDDIMQLPLDEKSPFQHTQRGAIYTNDFLTYMPR